MDVKSLMLVIIVALAVAELNHLLDKPDYDLEKRVDDLEERIEELEDKK